MLSISGKKYDSQEPQSFGQNQKRVGKTHVGFGSGAERDGKTPLQPLRGLQSCPVQSPSALSHKFAVQRCLAAPWPNRDMPLRPADPIKRAQSTPVKQPTPAPAQEEVIRAISDPGPAPTNVPTPAQMGVSERYAGVYHAYADGKLAEAERRLSALLDYIEQTDKSLIKMPQALAVAHRDWQSLRSLLQRDPTARTAIYGNDVVRGHFGDTAQPAVGWATSIKGGHTTFVGEFKAAMAERIVPNGFAYRYIAADAQRKTPEFSIAGLWTDGYLQTEDLFKQGTLQQAYCTLQTREGRYDGWVKAGQQDPTTGLLEQPKYHGYKLGVLRKPDGTEIIGMWENGFYRGSGVLTQVDGIAVHADKIPYGVAQD